MPCNIDEAVKRFAAAIESLTGANTAAEEIGFAVSGGPDSMAMLVLAQRHFGSGVRACTVDHRLRPEAADEAAQVAHYCAAHGIAHRILAVEQPITGNLQSGARDARYALLARWADEAGCKWIATAHHADDQLETLLMRIARGAGISGLSAIRPRNGRIIRPLLGFTKEEMENLCEDAGVIPARDPSNDDPDFDRVRMRQWLARSEPPFSTQAVARSVGALQQSHDALEWTARGLFAERVLVSAGSAQINPVDVPPELQRRLLLLALAELAPVARPRGALIDRTLATLREGEKTMVGDILCTGGVVWTLAPAPLRRT